MQEIGKERGKLSRGFERPGEQGMTGQGRDVSPGLWRFLVGTPHFPAPRVPRTRRLHRPSKMESCVSF